MKKFVLHPRPASVENTLKLQRDGFHFWQEFFFCQKILGVSLSAFYCLPISLPYSYDGY
ncbi:MAG: hypothetical protein NTV93_21185 [Verrucomicrobia bacterium]|nr:hypothetical protein [Verrucomicrobiota bacterium]